jgi:hypothetical protein
MEAGQIQGEFSRFQRGGPDFRRLAVGSFRRAKNTQFPASTQPDDGNGELTSGVNLKRLERGNRARHHYRTGAISRRSPTWVPER